MKKPVLVITGGAGLVGSGLLQALSPSYAIVSPTRQEMDITKREAVHAYVASVNPHVIIHAAAFTDATVAEKERGNLDGQCWRINVEGTRFIAHAAKNIGAWIIYVSTGSVFAGNSDNPGPFSEEYPLSDSPDDLSWSGWTKACAEKELQDRAVVIRISHPVKRVGLGVERDYIHTLLHLYDIGKLFPLFDDQWFPVTYIADLALAMNKSIQSIKNGTISKGKTIYHVASPDLVTPYLLARAVIKKGRGITPELTHGSMDEFLKTTTTPLRFTKYCAIDGTKTQKELGLSFKPWKEIVDAIFPLTNSFLGSGAEAS